MTCREGVCGWKDPVGGHVTDAGVMVGLGGSDSGWGVKSRKDRLLGSGRSRYNCNTAHHVHGGDPHVLDRPDQADYRILACATCHLNAPGVK